MNLEDYPRVTTMGLAFDPAAPAVWRYNPTVPPGWYELEGPVLPPPVITLGPPQACTQGTPVTPAGPYVLSWYVDPNAWSQLFNSTGTNNSPVTGQAFPVIVT